MRERVYENSASPYLKLLKMAGCDFSDLCGHVHQWGVEDTLRDLAKEGVYLTSEEFKGKKEVLRGSASFRVSPEDFRRAPSSAGFMTQSSGTRSQPLRSFLSLDRLALSAADHGLFLSAHDLLSRHHIIYDAILPANGGIRILLIHAKLGLRADRWFANRVPLSSQLETMFHRLVTDMIVLSAKCVGSGIPLPEFVEAGDVKGIVAAISERVQKGHECCVTTVASNGARIAQTAWELGADLRGTAFVLGSEPVTEHKRKTIERVGGRVIPTYGFADGGQVGRGCANPVYTDDVHVLRDRLAVVPNAARKDLIAAGIQPLLFTTLYPSAPLFLLNVENGDYAVLEERNCGCALEKGGFTLHIHHIRSYEKLTSQGMNYFYGDLFDLFEKSLPSEFGGGPGDYQLLEEENESGQTLLVLVVHPRIGRVNEEALLARLRQALAEGSRGNRFMASVWQDAGTLRLKRQIPYASPRGKVLPLHIPH